MHTEITILKCSLCGAEVDRVVKHDGFRVDGSSLGPASAACKHCETPYDTGKSEWADKTMAQKTAFILGRVLWTCLSAVMFSLFSLVLVWILVATGLIPEERFDLGCVVAVGVTVFVIGWRLVRHTTAEIEASLARTAAKESAFVAVDVRATSSPR
jgi:hypothetical protein